MRNFRNNCGKRNNRGTCRWFLLESESVTRIESISRRLDERWRVGRAFLLLDCGLWLVWRLNDPFKTLLQADRSHRFARVWRRNRLDRSAQKLCRVGCFDFIARTV